jgi:hypothetical protein
MGLRDWFRRKDKGPGRAEVDVPAPMGLGEDFPPGFMPEPMDGGPSIYRSELAQYRWMAQAEAVNLVRSNHDPVLWPGGQMAFDLERALAHDHEALRDRLANMVGMRVRHEVAEMYPIAASVAGAHEDLRVLDNDLVRVARDYDRLYSEVEQDPLELGRYYRLRSKKTQGAKKFIAFVFVLSEFIISGYVFDQVLASEIPFLGYVFALGLMMLLIIVPHYTAQGLKEGVTEYHLFDRKKYLEKGEDVPVDLQRMVRAEQQDDTGFRVIAGLVLAIALALILPLTVLRMGDEFEGWEWFAFFLLLQLGISGYFFLREWLDHGMASHNLWKLAEQSDELTLKRSTVLQHLTTATADFHAAAERLIFTIQQAPRWDSYIVETSVATIHHIRAQYSVHRPDIAPFIDGARMPYHGSADSIDESDWPLDPLSNEHRSLDEKGPLGREWLMRQLFEALNELPPLSIGRPMRADNDRPLTQAERDAAEAQRVEAEKDREEIGWLLVRSPAAILREFLRRLDLPEYYSRPKELDFDGAKGEMEQAEEARLDDDPPEGSDPDVPVDQPAPDLPRDGSGGAGEVPDGHSGVDAPPPPPAPKDGDGPPEPEPPGPPVDLTDSTANGSASPSEAPAATPKTPRKRASRKPVSADPTA